MISLKTFTQTIQDGLNAISGINFKVFADAGKYEKAIVKPLYKTKFTSCVLRAGSSSAVPTQGVTVASQTVMLEVCVRFTPETMDSVITAHRAGKSYTVAATYAIATTGTVEQRPLVGTSLTYFVNISYSFVENGLNSNSFKFTLDGDEIPYTVASIRKTPTTDGNIYSDGNGNTKARNTAFIHTFEFQIPALSGAGVSSKVISNLLGNELNTMHTLVVTVDDAEPQTYTVIFGETECNVQGVNNGGMTFSLTEAFVGA